MATKKKSPSRKPAVTPKSTAIQQTDRQVTPRREETVSFEVLCTPKSSAALPQMMLELNVETVERSRPEARTLNEVAKSLPQKILIFSPDHALCLLIFKLSETFCFLYSLSSLRQFNSFKQGDLKQWLRRRNPPVESLPLPQNRRPYNRLIVK